MTILLRFLPHAVLTLGGLIIGAMITSFYMHKKYLVLETRFMNYQVAQAEVLAAAHDAAELTREQQLKTIQELENESAQKSQADAKTIRDLHARYDRLRITKTNCSRTSSVPEAPDPAISVDAGPGREFFELNGRSFIDLAERAERIRAQALTCQRWAQSMLE